MAMVDSKYTLKSERLGFRMLDKHDLHNILKLDMGPEVRGFFPGGSVHLNNYGRKLTAA